MKLSRVVGATAAVILLTSCRGGSHHFFPPLPDAAARRALSVSDAYPSTVLADGPTTYYRLDDTAAGTAADSSGNGLNGSVGSSVTQGASGLLPASSDTAMSFPGIASPAGVITTAQSALLQPSSALSFEAWIRFATSPATKTIALAYGSNTASAPYALWFNNGNISAQFTLSNGAVQATSPNVLQPNTTYYIAGTYDGNTASLYVNGSLAASTVQSGTIAGYTSGYGLGIGDDAATTAPAFNGTIDEVAVYAGKTLTAAQIANHYNAGTHVATPTPVPTPTATPAAVAVVQTCGNGSVGAVGSISVSCAPAVQGDALIAIVFAYSGQGLNNGITTPPGWTNYDSAFSKRNEIATYSRVVGAGDTTTTSWGFSMTTGLDYMNVVIYELSGVDTAHVVDQHGTSSYTLGQTTETTPVLTPSAPNEFAIATFGNGYRAPSAPPANWSPYQLQKGVYEGTYSMTAAGVASVQATASWTTGPATGQANLVLIEPSPVPTPAASPTPVPAPVPNPTPAPSSTPAAAISVVQTCGSASGTAVARISAACAPPVQGDALVAVVFAYNGQGLNNGITTPPGWTNYDSTFSKRNEIATYSRVVGAGDTTTTSWAFAMTTGLDYMSVAIYELSGVNAAQIVDQHGTSSYTLGQTTETTPALTPSGPSEFAIATFGNGYRAPSAAPANWAPYQLQKGVYESTYSMTASGTAGVQATASWTTGPSTGQANLLLIEPSAVATPQATASPAPVYTDWSTFGDTLARTEYNPNETTLSSASVPNLKLVWKANLGAAITAQPVIATGVTINGTATNVAYVGTENGTFYALDATTGATLWTASLANLTSGCMDLPGGRFGITGTATFDRRTNRVYVADGHDFVHALDMSTGAELTTGGWPVSVTNQFTANHIYSGLAFNPANGLLYVTTGSYCDLNNWQGRIAVIDTTSATLTNTFYPATPYNGDGIWGMGGPAIDANNDVYIATGNTTGGANDASGYGDALVHLTSSLSFVAAQSPGPVQFDNDFGASPMAYQPPGCPPLVTVKRKDGGVYTWQTANVGGQPQSLIVAHGTDTGQFVGAEAYSSATNLVYVGVPAGTTSNGVTYTNGLIALAPQADCTLAMAWQQNAGTPAGNGVDDNYAVTVASDVVYMTDGIGKHVFAFNASTGAPLWNSGNTINGPVMASPTVDGRVYVSGWDGYLYSFGL